MTSEKITITMPSTLRKDINIHIETSGATFSGYLQALAKKDLQNLRGEAYGKNKQ